MASVYSYSETDDWISIYLCGNGREGTYTLAVDEEIDEERYSPEVLEALYAFQRSNNESVRLDCLQKIIDQLDVQIADLPHIEDCSEALQKVYAVLTDPCRVDDVFFIEDMSDEEFKDEWGMSKAEFERQLDADDEKYHLYPSIVNESQKKYPNSGCIEFSDDDFYACFYPALRDAFTNMDSNVRENEKSADISKENKIKNLTMAR